MARFEKEVSSQVYTQCVISDDRDWLLTFSQFTLLTIRKKKGIGQTSDLLEPKSPNQNRICISQGLVILDKEDRLQIINM